VKNSYISSEIYSYFESLEEKLGNLPHYHLTESSQENLISIRTLFSSKINLSILYEDSSSASDLEIGLKRLCTFLTALYYQCLEERLSEYNNGKKIRQLKELLEAYIIQDNTVGGCKYSVNPLAKDQRFTNVGIKINTNACDFKC
jgi:hypothetical protein